MVTAEEFKGEKTFRCDACGFHYRDKDNAQACQDFCHSKKGCSPEINKNALERGV